MYPARSSTYDKDARMVATVTPLKCYALWAPAVASLARQAGKVNIFSKYNERLRAITEPNPK